MNKKLILRKGFVSAIFVLCLSLFASSCLKDELLDTIDEIDERGVAISLNIQGTTDVATRGNQELPKIHRGYIFVNTETGYLSHEEINVSYIDNNGSTKPTIYSKILATQKTDNNTIVTLILNPQEGQISDFTGQTFSETIALLPLFNSEVPGIHDVSESKGMPMYGSVGGWENSAESTDISVASALAKLEVQYASTITGKNSTNFTSSTGGLANWEIFNYAHKGFFNAILEYRRDIGIAIPSESIADVEIDRTLSVESTTTVTTNPLYLYAFPYAKNRISAEGLTVVGDDGSSDNNINYGDDYTHHKHRLAIIVKSNNNRYYRLNLCRNRKTHIDIEHNHSYRIIIKEVNDNGHASAQLAYDGPPSNVLFDIIDATGTTTISNGHYAISIGEQPYADKEITVLVPEIEDVSFNVFDMRYILAEGITSLPSDTEQSIVAYKASSNGAISNQEDDLIVVNTTLSDQIKKLNVTFKYDVNNQTISKLTRSFFLKIKLGSLEFTSGKITINKIDAKPMDSHMDEFSFSLPSDTKFMWDTNNTKFLVVTDNTNTNTDNPKYTIKSTTDNATPVRWVTYDQNGHPTTVSNGDDINAVPIFEDNIFKVKTSVAGSSQFFEFEIVQLAPIYIGRFGSPIDVEDPIDKEDPQLIGKNSNGNVPLRRRAIMENIPVVSGAKIVVNQYQANNWNMTDGKYVTQQELNQGTSKPDNSLNIYPVRSCLNLNGKNPNSEDVKWYLPSQNQIYSIGLQPATIYRINGSLLYATSSIRLNTAEFEQGRYSANELLLGPMTSGSYTAFILCIRDL